MKIKDDVKKELDELLEKRLKKTQISRLLKIDRTTIYRYLQKKKDVDKNI